MGNLNSILAVLFTKKMNTTLFVVLSLFAVFAQINTKLDKDIKRHLLSTVAIRRMQDAVDPCKEPLANFFAFFGDKDLAEFKANICSEETHGLLENKDKAKELKEKMDAVDNNKECKDKFKEVMEVMMTTKDCEKPLKKRKSYIAGVVIGLALFISYWM